MFLPPDEQIMFGFLLCTGARDAHATEDSYTRGINIDVVCWTVARKGLSSGFNRFVTHQPVTGWRFMSGRSLPQNNKERNEGFQILCSFAYIKWFLDFIISLDGQVVDHALCDLGNVIVVFFMAVILVFDNHCEGISKHWNYSYFSTYMYQASSVQQSVACITIRLKS